MRGYGELPGDRLGWCTNGCGDMNGDGVPDFAAGNVSSLSAAQELVRVFSGATGAVIHEWRGPRLDSRFGERIASGGLDLDRDGVPDLLVAAYNEFVPIPPFPSGVYQSAVYAFSGRDGSQIFVIRERSFGYGARIAPLPSQPDGPFPRFAICAPNFSTAYSALSYEGRVDLYRSAPQSVTLLGPACTGSSGQETHAGLRHMGPGGLRVTLSGAEANVPAALLLGHSSELLGGQPVLPLSLQAAGFPGCFLFTSADYVAGVRTGSVGLSAGYAMVDLPHPVVPIGMPPLKVHAQWIVLSPSQPMGALSDALTWQYR